jgi:hypothetical protein
MTDHDKRDAGSVPSIASLAEPRNATASPAPQVKVLAGASMEAVGGESPAVMTTASTPKAPWLSATMSLAVCVPGCV